MQRWHQQSLLTVFVDKELLHVLFYIQRLGHFEKLLYVASLDEECVDTKGSTYKGQTTIYKTLHITLKIEKAILCCWSLVATYKAIFLDLISFSWLTYMVYYCHDIAESLLTSSLTTIDGIKTTVLFLEKVTCSQQVKTPKEWSDSCLMVNW